MSTSLKRDTSRCCEGSAGLLVAGIVYAPVSAAWAGPKSRVLMETDFAVGCGRARFGRRLLRNRGEIDLEIERLRRCDARPGDAGGRVRRNHPVVVANEGPEAGARGDAPERWIESGRRNSSGREGRAEVRARGEREIDQPIRRVAAIVERHVDAAGGRDAHLGLEPVARGRGNGNGSGPAGQIG